MKPLTTHYCKALLKTGKPIVVTDTATGKEKHTALWRIEIYDKHGEAWILEMIYVKDKKLTKGGVRVQLVLRKKYP